MAEQNDAKQDDGRVDKPAILVLLTPRAVLRALTPESERAVSQGVLVSGMVAILRFPFRVGRESRVSNDGKFHRVERPKRGSELPNNDLYLVDAGMPLQISREHFQIEQTAAGYVLKDRGSACGTMIGKTCLGGADQGGRAPLRDGDRICIGAEVSPYVFRFIALA